MLCEIFRRQFNQLSSRTEKIIIKSRPFETTYHNVINSNRAMITFTGTYKLRDPQNLERTNKLMESHTVIYIFFFYVC